MIKLLGVLCVFLPIASIGFLWSLNIKRKILFYEEMLLLNKNIEIEICYKSNDIFNIAEEASSDKRYENLFFLKSFKNLKNNYSYENIKNFFKLYKFENSQIKDLTDYFNKIGKSDIENQIKHLKMYEKIFENKKNSLIKKYTEKSKVYKSLSLFFGLGIAILIL